MLGGCCITRNQNVCFKSAFIKALQYSFLYFSSFWLAQGLGLILFAEAWPGPKLQRCTSLAYIRERQWVTGRGCFCCSWRLSFSSHARSSWFGSGTTLLVWSPHSIYITEGFTTFSSHPGPAVVNQSFPLPFNFSSRCNYCNALKLGTTPEAHSEATAATHCGFPLARNCSPQATCHNSSFNTLYRFASLMIKVSLI